MDSTKKIEHLSENSFISRLKYFFLYQRLAFFSLFNKTKDIPILKESESSFMTGGRYMNEKTNDSTAETTNETIKMLTRLKEHIKTRQYE